MQLHHLGIAVLNLEQAVSFYSQLGFQPEGAGPIELKSRGVKVMFMVNDEGTRLELVEKPAAEASPYHLAYSVTGTLSPEIENLTAGQWGEVPELGINNVFITGPGGERIELVRNK